MNSVDYKQVVDISILPVTEVFVGSVSGAAADKLRSLLCYLMGCSEDSHLIKLIVGSLVNGLTLYAVGNLFFRRIEAPPTGFFIFFAVYFANQPEFLKDLLNFSGTVNGTLNKALGLEATVSPSIALASK